MDIRDSQRIKQIRDNTKKMADAFTRIADALERLIEPQTDYERGRQEAWDIAQKVFDSTVTLYEAEDVAKQIAKDEPQTERHLPDYSYEADLGKKIMEQTKRSE